MPRLLTVFALLATFHLSAPALFAQAGRSGLNGTVFDEAKAVMPGVTVTATHEGTGLTRTAVTGPEGRFTIPTLTPGTYTVTVELTGFQTAKRAGVALSVGQELSLDFTLRVATLEEAITVTGQAPV